MPRPKDYFDIPTIRKLDKNLTKDLKKLPDCIPLSHAKRTLSRYKERFVDVYEWLVGFGLRQSEICTIFGMSKGNFVNFTTKHNPEFEIARQKAMQELEGKLTARMLMNAIGYDYEEEEITYTRKRNEMDETEWTPFRKKIYKKHQPGDGKLLLSFLYNRFSSNWKNSTEIISKKESYDSEPGQRTRRAIESLGRAILEDCADRPETKCVVSSETSRIPDELNQRNTQ